MSDATQFAATPFTTPLVTSRVGIDPTGNIWQLQGTRGMVNVGTILTAPVNTVAPAISGTLAHGSTLTSTTGTWTGSSITYSYQWYGAGAAISGATSSTYVTQASDVGNMITCVVTASNTGGAPSATSNALGPIT